MWEDKRTDALADKSYLLRAFEMVVVSSRGTLWCATFVNRAAANSTDLVQESTLEFSSLNIESYKKISHIDKRILGFMYIYRADQLQQTAIARLINSRAE